MGLIILKNKIHVFGLNFSALFWANLLVIYFLKINFEFKQ